MGNPVLSVTFAENMPPRVLKHVEIKGKVSTDGSDEELTGPKATLSFAVPNFSYGPARYYQSGYKYRLNGLRLALTLGRVTNHARRMALF